MLRGDLFHGPGFRKERAAPAVATGAARCVASAFHRARFYLPLPVSLVS
jgi:hypothetical protein